MNNSEIKKLLLDLIKVDTESDIKSILEKEGLYNNPSAWRDFGDKENNYSIIGNQQSLPEVALVEKIVNSIDSILTLRCIEKGYDPFSNKNPTPQSLFKAIEEFYGIKNGSLTELTPNERRKLAEENIGFVATGKTPKKGFGSYSIFDFGEGQTPEDMPSTFMSIGSNNKIRIPFVQGKFNQGGTGVFRFGAEGACQLILSKRNPILSGQDNYNNKWSFSIVKRVQEPGLKSSKYVYLVNPINKESSNNNVFYFNSNSLRILPGEFPEAYSEEMKFGTYLKLYEYKLERFKSNICLNLYYRLSLLLPNLPIPVRFYERRSIFKGNTLESTLNGLTIRLEEDRSSNLESDNWPAATSMNIEGITVPIKIYAFKFNEKKKRPTEQYTKNEGVIFVINGQTHGHFKSSFFKRKTVGLSNLADSLIVLVDCSNMNTKMREDLFMTSRDRLSDSGDLRKKLEKSIESLLKEHEGLKELKLDRHQKSIENKISDSKPFVDVINNIMRNSPSLSTLFLKGNRLGNPFKLTAGKIKPDYLGKEFPSFFKLTKEFPKTNPREFHNHNDKMRIQFKTDVKNDYFNREKDPGDHILKINGEIFERDYFINLWNGTATLNIVMDQKFYIGDQIKFSFEVNDVSHMIEPLVSEFYIKIIEPINPSVSNDPGNRVKPSDPGEGNELTKDQLGLPDIIEVLKDDDNWKQKKFNDSSALKYEDLGDEIGKTFFINMHNKYFLNERKNNKNIDSKIVESQYKYANSLIALSIIKAESDGDIKLGDEYSIDRLIDETTSSLSMVLLPMILELGGLSDGE